MSVTLTDQAAEVVKELLEKKGKPEAALRFGVQGGGCSGFSYMLAIDDDIEEDDHIFPHNGVKVVVDSASMQYVDGSEIEYADSMMGGGFSVNNPMAVSNCGCGSSFKTEESEASGGGCGSH